MKRVMWVITLLVLLISIGIFSFYYYGYYQKAELTGVVVAISEKGTLFKTYEGEVRLESFAKVRDLSFESELFKFSVDRSDKEIFNTLKDVALSGKPVRMEFIQRHAKFFWRGDTEYFIKSVNVLANEKPLNEDDDYNQDSENDYSDYYEDESVPAEEFIL